MVQKVVLMMYSIPLKRAINEVDSNIIVNFIARVVL